jgi:phenylacetate-coenzyme A ligase PaaK-like adenylate-forming protein
MTNKLYLTYQELKDYKLPQIEKKPKKRFRAMMRHCYHNHEAIRKLLQKNNVDWMDLSSPDDWERRKLALIRKIDFISNLAKFLVNPKQNWNSKENPDSVASK